MLEKLLELLLKLVPVWIAFLAIAFAYLIYLFKKASNEFISINKQQAAYLKDRFEVVDKSTVVFTRVIDQQEKEIKSLEQRVQGLTERVSENRSTVADLGVEEISSFSQSIEKVLKLQETTIDLMRSNTIRPESQDYADSIQHMRKELAKDLSKQVVKLSKKRDLSRYPIKCTNLIYSGELVQELKKSGFTASIHEPQRPLGKPEDHVAIWLGTRIPVEIACQAITIARSRWPWLKYIEIPGDYSDPPDYVNDELYFGGATSTVLERQHKEWTDEDFAKLQGELTLKEFHDLVRAHYVKPVLKFVKHLHFDE